MYIFIYTYIHVTIKSSAYHQDVHQLLKPNEQSLMFLSIKHCVYSNWDQRFSQLGSHMDWINGMLPKASSDLDVAYIFKTMCLQKSLQLDLLLFCQIDPALWIDCKDLLVILQVAESIIIICRCHSSAKITHTFPLKRCWDALQSWHYMGESRHGKGLRKRVLVQDLLRAENSWEHIDHGITLHFPLANYQDLACCWSLDPSTSWDIFTYNAEYFASSNHPKCFSEWHETTSIINDRAKEMS